MHVSGVGGRATVLGTCEEQVRNWWDRYPIVMLESVRRRTSKTLSTHRQMANRQRSRIGYLKRGGPRPGDLHCGSRHPPCAQKPVAAPGRVKGASGRRARHRDPHRLCANQGHRGRQPRSGSRTRPAGRRESASDGVSRFSLRHRGIPRRTGRAVHIDRVKPAPVPRIIPGGFIVDDFKVDHDKRTATCPNGRTRPINRSGWAILGAACRLAYCGPDAPAAARVNSSGSVPMTRGSAPRGGRLATRIG
jgi:hypothetical protein